MLMVFTEDLVFLGSFDWFWGVVTLTVRIRRLVIHSVTTGRSAPDRCACTGAVIWARDRHGGRWGRRRSLGIVIGLLVLLAAAGVAGRSTGWWTWNLADRGGHFFVACCLTQFWGDSNWSQLSKLSSGYGLGQVWKMSSVIFELYHKVCDGLAIWGFT